MFGAVASMVRAYEANRSWLKGTQGFNKLRKHYEQAVKKRTALTQSTCTPEELKAIKQRIRLNYQKARKRQLILLTGVFLSMSLLICYVSYVGLFNPPKHGLVKGTVAYADSLKEAQKLEKQINYYLEDGRLWLKKGHYHNARFQFNLILTHRPNHSEARHLLDSTLRLIHSAHTE